MKYLVCQTDLYDRIWRCGIHDGEESISGVRHFEKQVWCIAIAPYYTNYHISFFLRFWFEMSLSAVLL